MHNKSTLVNQFFICTTTFYASVLSAFVLVCVTGFTVFFRHVVLSLLRWRSIKYINCSTVIYALCCHSGRIKIELFLDFSDCSAMLRAFIDGFPFDAFPGNISWKILMLLWRNGNTICQSLSWFAWIYAITSTDNSTNFDRPEPLKFCNKLFNWKRWNSI